MKNNYGFVPQVGDRFGKWVVLDNKVVMVGPPKRLVRTVTCRCSCGKEKLVRILSLTSGKSSGCSCAHGLRKKVLAAQLGVGQLSKTQFLYYRHCANRRDIDWNLSMEYLWALLEKQNNKCALSGLDLHLELKVGPHNTASLDRINSYLPYIEGNVQWVHKDVNKMKSTFSDTRFIEICKLVAQHQSTDFPSSSR